MLSNVGRELLGEVRSDVQEVVQERIDDKVYRNQTMYITRAVAALVDANIEEER